MKCMAAAAGLESQKRLTNHSTRKHLVQKLRDSGRAPTDIMQISGHKNIQFVLNYSAISENKQKQCSRILSISRQQATAEDLPESNTPTSSYDVEVAPQTIQDPPVIDNIVAEQRPNAQVSMTINSNSVEGSNPRNPSSLSLLNDTINVNNEMSSLFSGAVLNIQNFHVYMK